MDSSRLNKFQRQYWVTKETVRRKFGKKEEDCIVASDASLDAKLELFKSIQATSSFMNKLLDRYQERICCLAQEQNSMGRFLKEFGKSDKTNAGKMMIQMGKSLIFASQQEITLRPPLLRLYQEVETFRHRAVEDTSETIRNMERLRTEYRASLKWMKNVSQELDPDTCKQMEKFRKVQTHVKKTKSQFDKLKLACLQKVDLLAAARCNMFSHALIHYQTCTMTITEKIANIFSTLALTFKGYQHFEFCVIKELVEPAQPSDHLLLDSEKTTNNVSSSEGDECGKEPQQEILLDISNSNTPFVRPNFETAAEKLRSNERLLENLLGGPLETSPETDSVLEALDFTLSWPSARSEGGGNESRDNVSTATDLLSDEFEKTPFAFEGDTAETMSLLSELWIPQSTSTDCIPLQNSLTPLVGNGDGLQRSPNSSSVCAFLPSQLLNFGGDLGEGDLLNFTTMLPVVPTQVPKPTKSMAATGLSNTTPGSTWYDIFADLDPIANPDAIGQREETKAQAEDNRYC